MLLLFLILGSPVLAQVFQIYNVSIFNGNGSFFDGTVQQAGPLQVIVNSTLPEGTFEKHPGTCELWSLSTNAIVDILGTHEASSDSFGCLYMVPHSMALGQYFVKAYVDGESATGLSMPFLMTAEDFDGLDACVSQPAYQPITSLSDKRYTSLRPFWRGRSVVMLADGSAGIEWFYVDYRNQNNVGITNLSLSIVNQDNGTAIDLGPASALQMERQEFIFKFSDINVKDGRWRAQMTYLNQFEKSGTPVVALSDIFFVMDDFCSSNAPPGQDGQGDHAIMTRGTASWVLLGLLFVSLFFT